jgi:hypothetical protein
VLLRQTLSSESLIDLLLSVLLALAVLLNDEVVQLLAVAGSASELLWGDLVELGAEGSAGLLNVVGHGGYFVSFWTKV